MGPIASDICRNCKKPGERETVEHIVCHCPTFAGTQLGMLSRPFFSNPNKVTSCILLRFSVQIGTFDQNTKLSPLNGTSILSFSPLGEAEDATT